LIRAILVNRKLVLKSITFSVIIGLIIAFGSKKEYNSSTTLIPSSEEGIKTNLGGLSSLAGLAGINLATSSDNFINPEIYPEITGSNPFLLDILNTKIYYSSIDSTLTTYRYFKDIYNPSIFEYLRKYTIGLPFTIKSMLMPEEEIEDDSVKRNSGIIKLSKEDAKLIEDFKERISASYDDQTGILNINIVMPDANASAEIAHATFLLLQKYLIKFKSEKAQENLEFIQARYQESKKNYEEIQEKLAMFNDQNQNIRLARIQIEQQNIQNEYNLAFDLYKSLATQLEQAKIKVKEDSPVLSVIDPPKVPVEKSKPQRLIILIIFLFLGLVFGVTIIIFNQPVSEFIQSVKKSYI